MTLDIHCQGRFISAVYFLRWLKQGREAIHEKKLSTTF
jgi:hypothetical protein